ncbi:carotenoid oxygenase family protein [Mycobacterium sp. NPDC050853]|uniref:carotenoid oxygenase family protein n=1 Tax=Mycobacteriaceae TaxID=1762 RepID=UPI0015DDB956|nr:carotenoid oxygenase family protein [Mycobacteroides sp. LB1]
MTATAQPTTVTSPYLTGIWEPVEREMDSVDLEVTGTLPDHLDGRYLRNGPNPASEVDPATYHLFSGDAMVHGLSLRDGKAQWYRNRWVRTPSVSKALGEPRPSGISTRAGMGVIGPNTSVMEHAGRTIALVEGGIANYELTEDLDTVGTCDFDGTLPGGYTAHPHTDPDTGEMHAVSYSFTRGSTIQYSVIGTDGRARRTVDIQVHGAPMMHDFTLTEKYVVFYDLPVTLDMSMISQSVPVPRLLRKPAQLVMNSIIGKVKIPGPIAAKASQFSGNSPSIPYSWNTKYPARIGVMPREGGSGDVRWFEIAPCYVFHPLNGYSETRNGSEVLVIDLVRYDSMFSQDVLGPSDAKGQLDRWTIDLTKGVVHMERKDDRHLEFPRINETLTGKKHRYGYLPDVENFFSAGEAAGASIVKYDYETGTSLSSRLDPAVVLGEVSFVPNPAAATEDDGVLIGFAVDRRSDEGQLLLLDAGTLDLMATVHLPQRVPAGFHGNWAPR